MSTSPNLTFNDGRVIPQLGYGVWQVDDSTAEDVVGQAFRAGYRHIDTAQAYRNEGGVGRAIAASGLDHNELFIATKLWNADHGYESTLKAFEDSMDRLGLQTLDLYLIHWLQPRRGKYVDTWKAMIELQKRGRAKSIGVSNFTIEALQEIIDETGIVPALNQVETHPYFNQAELRAFEAEKGILHESYSPIGSGKGLLDDVVLKEIADRHGASPAQVVIAWHLALGNVVIPKSVTQSRIIENWGALDVTLDQQDIDAINALDKGAAGRIGADPATADFS